MIPWSLALPAVLASFMASAVEFVEALTIVLAVGATRGWRSALLGVAAGVAVLALLVLALGPALAHVALPVLRGAIGTLLLLFGMRWLRKAILRAANVVAVRDEDLSFARQASVLREAGRPGRRGVDVLALSTTFKAVVLEGLEVVFIVIALGRSAAMLVSAIAGALLALLLVAALGMALRRPLSRVPENVLKFGVGAALSAFGSFWVGEAFGFGGTAGDAAIGGLIAAFVGAGLVLVAVARHLHEVGMTTRPGAPPVEARPAPRRAGIAFSAAREVGGLFVEDAGFAAGIVAVLLAAACFSRIVDAPSAPANAVVAAALIALLATSVLRRARS